ncbi:MAG: putative ABC transporter ATP-binding protein [Bacteroidetes bacterium ADurb.BinA261]|nr:ATP-binding cassette domain-containing protein [Dysgonamonadaceae bacterium]OPZ15342.1 MAG: putative ABC transporter ATP-binding protein [Bacteroidetes bacterium ADurb.BinA261]MBP9031657.1 ATP-binding cassette domain-containing protein [Dysgonamonadaceae bacterium]HOV36177.1 ATP-binding cassette domain-containing protein [Dysgonamonadaceae bacterium]HQG07272.1 ATP-binding cassette domain-containing protein [Dysgonamonadaceae bacterium]
MEKEEVIVVKNLYKSFLDKVILNGIDLKLHRGENLGIMGKSGIGKSVLAKCIVRLIEPDSGEINVLGKDVLACNDTELDDIRKKVGYLFQGGALYDSMSVRENLLFPIRRTQFVDKKHDSQELVERSLASVGLLDVIDKMPSELSGGMRKRVALARTLILRPEIILYDEPTTGLDAVTSGEISELIIKIREEYNTASIIITHDVKCAKIATDRISIMENGVFMVEGTYNELVHSDRKEIRDYFI